MLDHVKLERAESEIDKFIASRSDSRKAANEEAARQRAEDARKLREMRQEHKVLWVEHYRRLAACNLKAARDYRRRAREMQATEVKETA